MGSDSIKRRLGHLNAICSANNEKEIGNRGDWHSSCIQHTKKCLPTSNRNEFESCVNDRVEEIKSEKDSTKN